MADSESLESSEALLDSSPEIGEIETEIAPVDQSPTKTVAADGEQDAKDNANKDGKEKSGNAILADFNIFNAMLTASLLFILVATFLLFWELAGYGGLDGSWRTGSVGR